MGNPSEGQKKTKGGLEGCIVAVVVILCASVVLFILGFLLLSWIGGKQSSDVGKSEPKLTLNVGVLLVSGTSFAITNNDDSNWRNVEIRIDSHGSIYADSFAYKIPRILAGQTYTVNLNDFTKRDGTRFNPYAKKPQDTLIWGYTSKGFASWYGSDWR